MKPTTRTLLPLAGAALAYSLAQTMVIPALPELQAEFHANPADATWLLTAFLLTSSIATPLLGRLGDMHGKERWLLISLAIFGVGSLIAALGGSLAVLVTGRAVQGAGGAIFPLAIGIIRDEFPRERVLAKRARGDARRAEIFASLSAGERREAARLLKRLATAVEALQ